jgi:chromosome segregation ATPase
MNTRKFALFAAAFALVFAAAAIADTAKTKLYKWVDKNGVTQYGSSIPPEYASQGSQQLNAQGQVISTQSAQKTPEQLAAEAAAQKQADQQAQIAADTKKRDQVLLDTYTSVADIERDRDSKLSAIDAQINVLNGSIGASQNTLADFQGRAAELANKSKPVPPDLQKHIDGSRQQLIASQQQLLQQQQYRQQMQDQFVKDIARFKELTAQGTSSGG